MVEIEAIKNPIFTTPSVLDFVSPLGLQTLSYSAKLRFENMAKLTSMQLNSYSYIQNASLYSSSSERHQMVLSEKVRQMKKRRARIIT